uniref:Uncharacterized protein n=1 Tax=Anguilla anguilla TaxID=7936 RepID=A0A0E9QP31_ANGAN
MLERMHAHIKFNTRSLRFYCVYVRYALRFKHTADQFWDCRAPVL